MSGPVDPLLIMPGTKLPIPKSFEHWRNRVVCKLLGRLCDDDFNFGFDTVVKWMDGRKIDLAQVRASASDIMLATTGVYPFVSAVECEETHVVVLTVAVKNHAGEAVNLRSRKVNVKLLRETPPPEAVPIKPKKRA